MLTATKHRFDRWLSNRHRVQNNGVTLDRRQIYILPSGAGLAFCAVLIIMLLWAINYTNSLSFALTFLLGAIGLLTMWHTHNNLLDLQIEPLGAEPVFAGQPARFRYWLSVTGGTPRIGVGLQWQQPGADVHYTDVGASGVELAVAVTAGRRGWLGPGRLRVITFFPLGLFRAWSWVRFTQRCLVYPKPAGVLPLPLPAKPAASANQTALAQSGSDDYAGLRHYVSGDSPRHVAWRASARAGDDALLVKQFSGQAGNELWLDWQLPALAELDTEARLSQLCQWVLRADESGLAYGLRLPPQPDVLPARGSEHRARCLKALALYHVET